MSKAEAKREAFRRLATQRTNAVLEKLRVLGHCANPQLYEYGEEDIKRVFAVIRKELKSVEAKFNHRDRTGQFQL